MIVEVKVPVFAESIQEGTVLAWLKQPGDTVRRGEHLVDIETDKIVLEVVAPEDGILDRILKAQGEAVESEAVLASIDTEYGAREPGFEVAPPQVIPIESPAVAAEAPPLGPAARKLVAEHAIDAAAIRGTGREGRVTRADVRSFLETRAEASAPPPPSAVAPSPATPVPTAPRVEPERPPARPPAAPPPPAPGRGERREPLSRIRARIAERLVEAQRRAALLTTFNEIDMQAVAELRARHRESFEKTHGVRLGLMSFFVKAAVEALRRYPAVNAFIEQDAIVYHDYYDVGVAVGSPRGLVVPILRDADRLSFADIERQIGGFAERARDGKLKPEELVGGTFTITNGGVFGSLLSTPIVNPPQSAILGMHKIEERPVAENRQVVVRPMMYVALTYDHRIIDGREAVRFLVTIKEAIEEPARLLLGI